VHQTICNSTIIINRNAGERIKKGKHGLEYRAADILEIDVDTLPLNPATLFQLNHLYCWYSWVDSNHRPPDPQSAVQVFLNKIPVYICGIKACGALVVLVGDAEISLAQQSAGKVRKAGQY
jgi:hypothetical protein